MRTTWTQDVIAGALATLKLHRRRLWQGLNPRRQGETRVPLSIRGLCPSVRHASYLGTLEMVQTGVEKGRAALVTQLVAALRASESRCGRMAIRCAR